MSDKTSEAVDIAEQIRAAVQSALPFASVKAVHIVTDMCFDIQATARTENRKVFVASIRLKERDLIDRAPEYFSSDLSEEWKRQKEDIHKSGETFVKP